MRFEITDHAVTRYQDRIQEVPYTEAVNRLEQAMSHAKRIKTTAIGGGELWHYQGDPSFVAVCARDVLFRQHEWVVKTVITEAQAFKDSVVETDSYIVDELYADAQKDVETVTEFARAPLPLISSQLAKAPKHIKPILSQCTSRVDLNKLVMLAQLETAKWREAQKTIRTQATENAREQSYRELLRVIVRLSLGDNSELALSIRQHIADASPGLLSPAFHRLHPRECKTDNGIDLDALQQMTERLLAILKERQFGLVTWHMMLADSLHELSAMSIVAGVRE